MFMIYVYDIGDIQIINQFRQIRKMKIDHERGWQQTSSKQKPNKHNQQSYQHKLSLENISKPVKQQNDNYDYIIDRIHKYDSGDNQANHQHQQNKEIKNQNLKLKRMLKQAQAKRIQVTKQCSELATKYQKLQEQNMHLHRKIKDTREVEETQKFRYQQLKFLNKQLATQIQQLQKQNQMISDKLKHQSDIIEKKYQQLEQKTYKRIEQALKRIKKAIHYLSSLSTKEIQKTKSIQLENLTRAAEILKGKYTQNNKYEEQIEELMNPIRNIQEDLHKKNKEIGLLKQENARLSNEVKKHKKIEKQLLPQYKEAVEKLKKNLVQVRLQLTENQYEKCQVKRKYDEKFKEIQIKYEQLFKQNRKIKLENKIYEKKLEEIEDDVEEQKQRLMGENQLLKKLYKSEDLQISKNEIQKDLDLCGYIEEDHQSYYVRENQTDALSNKTTANRIRKTPLNYINKNEQTPIQFQLKNSRGTKINNNLKKNYSQSQLKISLQKQYHRQNLETKKTRQDQKSLRRREKLMLNQEGKKNNERRQRILLSRQSDSKRKNYEHLRHNQQSKRELKKNKVQDDEQKLELSEYHQGRQTSKRKFDHENGEENEENFEDQLQYGDRQQMSNNSMVSLSQQGLKNQIYKIDQEIIEIQKTLDRQLNMYK